MGNLSGSFGRLCLWLAAEAAFAGPVQEFKLHIPKVSLEELSANRTLRSGLHAYVLRDFLGNHWKAASWTLDYLKEKIPFEWVDYYPENMLDETKKPFLLKFSEAVQRFQQPSDIPRYMQIRLGRRGWQRLKKDLQPKPLPDVFWDDDEWIFSCMRDAAGKVDKGAIDNFFVTNQWKFLLIGEEGTTMFFHKDGTASSSWQAQLVGTKRWTLCPNSESHLLHIRLDPWRPDYQKFPAFAQALCGQVTVSPGELLYYPGYWWHQGQQMSTPTIAYTGALVGVEAQRGDLGTRKPHERFFDDLMAKCRNCWAPGNPERLCDDISKKWPGAAPPPLRQVCDSYLPKCLALWDEHATSLHEGREEL